MKKCILILLFILAFSNTSFCDTENKSSAESPIEESQFRDTSFVIGQEFYNAHKMTVFQGGQKKGNAYEATIQKHEYISCRYLGILNNSLQIEVLEITERDSIDNRNQNTIPRLNSSNKDKVILWIPINAKKQGLLNLKTYFGSTKSDNYNNVEGWPVPYEKNLLISITDEFGSIQIDDYDAITR